MPKALRDRIKASHKESGNLTLLGLFESFHRKHAIFVSPHHYMNRPQLPEEVRFPPLTDVCISE